MGASGNLWAEADADPGRERFTTLFERPGLLVEQIVSGGQATPPGCWYDQPRAEWVVLLAGAAGLRFADEATVRVMRPGDYVEIAAHRRHRVEWTLAGQATVWLAVHCDAAGESPQEK